MDPPDVVAALTAAVARTGSNAPLSSRLCDALVALTDATAGAITVRYSEPERVTLCATNELAMRLEDLQDLVGEGPGHSASASGQVEMAVVPPPGSSRWPVFSEAAQDIVDRVLIEAVPMKPSDRVFGVVTLYRTEPMRRTLERRYLQLLANAVGAALVREGDEGLDDSGPWASRSRIHQATGMLVAQFRVNPDDALALLRAHAYAQQTTLPAIAAAVVERKIRFPSPE